ncbi:MAG: hypothetical protein HY738_11395 [Bacteroidia bacterium]|nr:hypothetical protein [Bacteroidia bacterium]
MFADIEKIFINLKPEVAINEGGQITKTYTDKNTAIIKNGESGLLKFLCDNQSIKMLNGDMPDSLEFSELIKTYSKDEALFFFASERFILPFTYTNNKVNLECLSIGNGILDSLYKSDFIEGYLILEGIKLTIEERQFSYFKSLYKKYFKNEFSIYKISSDDFSPIRKRHYLCEVARKSKELRDKYLLKKIEEQLKLHDKVLVIFGGWHVLAIENALKQIMKNYE